MTMWRIAISSLLTFVVGLGAAGLVTQQSEPPDEPSWTWPEARWREAVEKVRAGRRLLPPSWPNGGKVAVTLSFDFDNETLSLRNGDTSPSRLSTGEYGSRSALPRVLDLLERYDIPATFFVPGVAAKLYPDDVKRIAEAGHELGIHGWIHEWTASLERDDERMLMERSLATLEELSGRRPVGIRTGPPALATTISTHVRRPALAPPAGCCAVTRPSSSVVPAPQVVRTRKLAVRKMSSASSRDLPTTSGTVTPLTGGFRATISSTVPPSTSVSAGPGF